MLDFNNSVRNYGYSLGSIQSIKVLLRPKKTLKSNSVRFLLYFSLFLSLVDIKSLLICKKISNV